MQEVLIIPKSEFEALKQEIQDLRAEFRDYMEQVDDEIRGYERAAAFAGVSVSTLEKLVKRRLIPFKKEGMAVSFSRKELIAYKRSRRIGKPTQ